MPLSPLEADNGEASESHRQPRPSLPQREPLAAPWSSRPRDFSLSAVVPTLFPTSHLKQEEPKPARLRPAGEDGVHATHTGFSGSVFLSIMGLLASLFTQQTSNEHLLLAKNYLGTWNTQISKSRALFRRFLQPGEESRSPVPTGTGKRSTRYWDEGQKGGEDPEKETLGVRIRG